MLATSTSTTSHSDVTIRLAAIDTLRTRFSGRKALRQTAERLADHPAPRCADEGLTALESLEVRLGLLKAEEAELRRAFRRAVILQQQIDDARREGETDAQVVRSGRVTIPGRAEIQQARAERRAVKRSPGAVERRVLAVARAAYAAAGFRTASHSHDLSIRFGTPSADSTSGTEWADRAGMSRAYCKVAYKIATSSHSFTVDLSILAVRNASEAGVMYLSPTLRVRQGRGTSLVTERLEAGARGALRWR